MYISWSQDCQEKYQQPHMQMIPLLMVESEEELKTPLLTVKEKSEKGGLKTQNSKS